MKKEIHFEDFGQDLIGLVVEQIDKETYEVIGTLIDTEVLEDLYVGMRIFERFMVVGGFAFVHNVHGMRFKIGYPITEIKTIEE